MTRGPEALVLAGLLSLSGLPAASAPSRAPFPDALEEAITRRDPSEAVRLSREMAAAFEAVDADPHTVARQLEELAERVGTLPGPEVAAFVEEQLVRSLELQERVEGRDRVEHLKTLEKLSEVYFVAGRWDRAEETDRRCLAIKMGARGPRDASVADAQRNLALSLFNQGKLRAAEKLIREAVTTLESLPDAKPLQVAYAVSDLADNLRAQGRYREATPLFERSVALAEQAVGPSHSELVALLINLGGLYRDTNRYGESTWRLGQALQIAQASPDVAPSERVSLWNNLAELHRLQGNFTEAERLYKVAIEATRESFREDHPKLATYQNQLGELLSEEGRFAEAEPLFREALVRRTRNLGDDHLDVAYTQKCLGQLLAREGRVEDAEASLRRALAIQESRLGARHPEVGTTVLALAEAVVRNPNRVADARTLVDRAIAILEATPAEPRAQAAAYAMRATLEQRAYAPARARADLARALVILEGLRPEAGGGEHTRARAFARFQGEFERMVDWQVQAGDVAQAFDYAERARGRVLLDQLSAGGVDLRSGIEPAERRRLEAREAEVQSRLAEYRERLRNLQSGTKRGPREQAEAEELAGQTAAAGAEFQAVYEEIKNASRFWRARGAVGGNTLSLERVQKELIGKHRLMLFYSIGGEQSFVFVVPPWGEKASVHRLELASDEARVLGAEAGPLDARRLRLVLAGGEGASAEGLLAQLSSPPAPGRRRVRLERGLHALWRVLVPPSTWADLLRSDEVIVVPDGLLHQLPFEILVAELGLGDTASRYWLDAGPAIRYAASATALERLSEAVAGSDEGSPLKVVSISDPEFGEASFAGRTLERLPGTARESEAIEAAFAGMGTAAAVQVLQGKEAREAAVRAVLPGARYLHLATHGLVDESHEGLFATLALTPGPRIPAEAADDGQLQLYEIYGLALRSELAVLSSCESRVGRVVAGEGVFALSRAFLAAGARRVVASLWPAEDDSTAEIIGAFFRAAAAAEVRGREARLHRGPDPGETRGAGASRLGRSLLLGAVRARRDPVDPTSGRCR